MGGQPPPSPQQHAPHMLLSPSAHASAPAAPPPPYTHQPPPPPPPSAYQTPHGGPPADATGPPTVSTQAAPTQIAAVQLVPRRATNQPGGAPAAQPPVVAPSYQPALPAAHATPPPPFPHPSDLPPPSPPPSAPADDPGGGSPLLPSHPSLEALPSPPPATPCAATDHALPEAADAGAVCASTIAADLDFSLTPPHAEEQADVTDGQLGPSARTPTSPVEGSGGRLLYKRGEFLAETTPASPASLLPHQSAFAASPFAAGPRLVPSPPPS